MAFNISTFSSYINYYGVARQSLFEVTITLPPNLQHLTQEFPTRDMTFFCNSVTIPEIGITTQEYKNLGMGLPEARPSGYSTGALAATFIVDSQMNMRTFFEKWLLAIVNLNVMDEYIFKDLYGKFPYEFAYKEDYAAIMDIVSYNEAGDRNMIWKYSGVFPEGLPSQTYSWGNPEAIQELSIGFYYDKVLTSRMDRYSERNPITNEPNSEISSWLSSRASDGYTTGTGNDPIPIPNNSNVNNERLTDEEGNEIFIPSTDHIGDD